MKQFLGGGVAALLLFAAGLLIWRAQAERRGGVSVPAPAAVAAAGAAPNAPLSAADLAAPPAATERSREQKRFGRYDRDRNGAISMPEYLANRHKSFDKLDTNHDGVLSFEEYAAKAVAKFRAADRKGNGQLDAAEFATTRAVRRARPRPKCAPAMLQRPQADAPEDAEG